MNKTEQETCINPENSVVVTACAGSGKTWLLTSRIIRIILENIHKLEIDDGEEKKQSKGSFQLSSILAITFTNNAAAEIEDRVRKRLREMAGAEEKKLEELLEEIGVAGKYTSADIKNAYRKFLLARPQLSVFTFHSWFSQLINYLPWGMRPSLNSMVSENTEDLKLQAWQRVLRLCSKDGATEADDMEFLLGCHKLPDLRKLLANIFERRSDWFLYYGSIPEDSDGCAETYKKFEGRVKENISLPEKCTKDQLCRNEMMNAARSLVAFCKNEGQGKALEKRGKELGEIISKERPGRLTKEQEKEHFACLFHAIRDVFLRKSDSTPRQPLGRECEHRDDYKKLVKEIKHIEDYEKDGLVLEDVRKYNKACARLAILYYKEYTKIKKEEGVIDYADMEFYPLRAIVGSADKVSIETILNRMDTAYKHILVDEFQDSNPVQWQILRAWLEESEQKDANGRPRVFIVGDPKQSIYSFRNGNPQLLQTAQKYLCESAYKAECVKTNLTRRCAQPLVNALNEFFQKNRSRGERLDFSAHSTDFVTPHSSLILLEPADPEPKKKDKELRDPLDPTIPLDHGEVNARTEGEAIAKKMRWLIGKKIIYNKDKEVRECTPGDIMLLYPSGKNIDSVVNAIIEAGLPCALPASANRMDSLECQDMVALLHAIFDPSYNLMLAQVLRSPVFNIDEQGLWKVMSEGKKEKDGKYSNWSRGLEKAAKETGASKKLKTAQDLLSKWQSAYRKDKLPTHELLSMCFHDADIISNYAKAVPQEMRKRTVLNLEWLLNHSLDASRGSLVLPSEYVDYMRGLGKAQEKSDADAEHPGTIRVLTVHKAKGLQSPIVFLANCNYKPRADGNQLIVSWGKDTLGKVPEHISFYRSAKKTSGQGNYVDSNKETKQHENSNLLYVAMTRASQHLILSKRQGGAPEYKWWDEVQKHLFNVTDGEPASHRFGKEIEEADSSVPLQKTENLAGKEWPEEPKNPKKPKTTKIPPSSEQAIRGTQLHNLLALELQSSTDKNGILQLDLLKERLGPSDEKAWSLQRRLLGIGKILQKDLMEQVKIILTNKKENERYFGFLLAQNPSIECELPAVDNKGKSNRIDCLLTTNDNVIWILDFKTGDAEKSEHDEQLRGYYKIVEHNHRDVTIKMAIVDSDGKLREVKPE